MDAANLLKPALARGELRCIGATTLDEYPRAHREGPRPGAAVPAGLRRRADGRGHDRHPPRPEGAVRGPPQGQDQGLGPGRRGQARRRATSPTASCPTRRSTWSTRPPAGWRWSSSRSRPRSTSLQRRLLQLQLAERMLAERGGGARPRAARRGRGGDRSRSRRSSRTCAASGRWRSPGLGDVQKLRERLAAVKIEYKPGLGRDPADAAARRAARREASTRTWPSSTPSARTSEKRIAQAEALGDGQPEGRPAAAQEGGRLRGDRRGRQPVDRHPRRQDAHHRAREAAEARGPDPPADGRPGRGRQGRGRRRPPQPRRACRTRTGRSARSCSSARPAWARPSWPRPWPSSSSTARRPWSGST